MKGRRFKFLLLTTALTLAWIGAAPASYAQPAPVRNYGASAPPANGAVTAQPGDTLSSIAKRYKVPLNALADANGLPVTERIGPGRRLVLPVARTHKVAPNDTMFSLSRMYGTTVDKLAAENGIGPPYALKAGQVLKIPAGVNGVAASAKPALQQQQASSPPRAAPVPPSTASNANTENRMLKKPGPSPVTKAFDSLIGKLAAEDADEVETVPKVSLVSAATAEPATRGAEMVGRSSGRRGFIWPVKGQVISSYGPKTGGLYNDGINIAAPRGTPVKAASGGTVAYVGEMRSYGNLVLIRHANGMITAYAHLNTVAVKSGAKVAQGQVIGSVGSSGTVMNAQLHFEVRRGKTTLDPKEYLG